MPPAADRFPGNHTVDRHRPLPDRRIQLHAAERSPGVLRLRNRIKCAGDRTAFEFVFLPELLAVLPAVDAVKKESGLITCLPRNQLS